MTMSGRIAKAFRYIFYKQMRIADALSPTKEGSEWVAALVLATLLLGNLETLFPVLAIVIGKKVGTLGHWGTLTTQIAFVILNYWFFIRHGRHKRIREEFKNEQPLQRRLGYIYAAIYIFGTLFLFMWANIIRLFMTVGK